MVKSTWAIAVLLAILSAPLVGQEKPKRFQIVVTITADSLTLEQAAKLEARVRENHATASVNIEVREMLRRTGPVFYIDSILTIQPKWNWETFNNLLLTQ